MAGPTLRLPPRRVRRAGIPVVLSGLLVVWGLSGLGLLVGVVALPVTRRGLRAAAFLFGYCAVQVVVLVAAGLLWLRRPRVGPWSVGSSDAWDRSNHRLLTAGVGWVLRLARVCFGYRVSVADGPPPVALEEHDPVLVLARHAGPGDTYSLAHLLLHRYRRRVRIVLKDVLQIDPALDVMLNRIGALFLPPGQGQELAARLAGLAERAEGRDAILVFPEGGNWTPERRERAIAHLRRTGKTDAADAADDMPHVLPPRPAGVLACLEARPTMPVVVVAHAGLDRLVGFRQWWRAVPLRVPMTVQPWEAPPPPRAEAARIAWLTAEWAALDAWVRAHHAAPGAATAAQT